MGNMKRVGLIAVLVVAALVAVWSFNSVRLGMRDRFEVTDCSIDSLTTTLNIKIMLPDTVLKTMARIGVNQIDCEIVGVTIDAEQFQYLMMQGQIARAEKAAAKNGGIYDREKRR